MEQGRRGYNIDGASQGAPALRVLDVEVGYDEEFKTYYVIWSDIPGLKIETSTFEAFVEVAVDAAPDLLIDVNVPTRINFKQAVELIPADGR